MGLIQPDSIKWRDIEMNMPTFTGQGTGHQAVLDQPLIEQADTALVAIDAGIGAYVGKSQRQAL
ncbi:hypothetical protein C3F00_030670 [Pseudomonas sp. MWU13-2860]|nr:hypothetical protein C3F00_030670 [Pseudomonas sp. MWU13-2860]